MNDTQNVSTAGATLREQHGGYVDRREYLYDDPTFSGAPFAHVSSRDDRRDGALRPVYATEHDLAKIRGAARQLVELSGIRTGALDALTNYVLGSGFRYVVHSLREWTERRGTLPAETSATLDGWADVRPAGGAGKRRAEVGSENGPLAERVDYTGGNAARHAVAAVQDFLDEFLDENDFHGSLDREIHARSREDGEAFVLLTPRPGGFVRVSLVEPDQVTEPADPRPLEEWIGTGDEFPSCWKFGVHTPAGRTDEPLGYHVVYDGAGRAWDYIRAARLQHIKRNVTRNAKRGVSDFYEVARDLRQEARLRQSMGAGAALQASIAWILELPAGTTAEQAKAITSSMEVYDYKANGQGRLRGSEQYRPGTILRTGPGQAYKPGPHGSDRNNGFQLVGQYLLRSVGVRWNMPEYMISGDASNANYASTLVAESPFVKAREADQQFYRRHFLSLLWKALRLAWEAGRFERLGLSWSRLYRLIDITCDVPAVATRDALQLAQTQETQIRMGILSRRTAATQAGLDFDAEVQNEK